MAFTSRFELIAALLLAAASAGAAAPEDALEFESLDGDRIRLTRKAEGVVLVHFWASWCPSCIEELPLLDRAAAACAATGLRVLAVNVGEDVETITRLFPPGAAQLEIARDPRGRIWREVSGVGLPLNLVWTATESRVDLGPRTLPEWQREFAKLGCRVALPERPDEGPGAGR